uniref:Uncharacterized protein n=1 Tax=Trypanosoma vivax (strain Y486) TaxID=1055687 RepID=G0U8S7_TRYVY|nr:hypothetical protein TVY486_1114920 [Trypanosoma vivax Y486]
MEVRCSFGAFLIFHTLLPCACACVLFYFIFVHFFLSFPFFFFFYLVFSVHLAPCVTVCSPFVPRTSCTAPVCYSARRLFATRAIGGKRTARIVSSWSLRGITPSGLVAARTRVKALNKSKGCLSLILQAEERQEVKERKRKNWSKKGSLKIHLPKGRSKL